jgi:hypothetical protein
VGATAGAVGAGVIAAALASGLPATQRVTPVDHRQAGSQVADLGTVPQAVPQPAAFQALDASLNAAPMTGLTVDDRAAWTGAAAVPAVTTTVLRHLLSNASLVPQSRASTSYLGSGGLLAGGYPSASR